ncbi:hypothetical protein AALP_AA7G121600 [Arabis alpina]|uniref:Uncharacterized protein n=1 Tax=Arabis alpina TaxID=50452 RepID=A0A087GHJ2_ARAAL|nr:hypothetical protein AALP_AA7G121600 [Arabis alpina]
MTRVLDSNLNDAMNVQSPTLVDERVVDTHVSLEVKVEENNDEINERFDLALFLQKQESSTHGRRRVRKFRPPKLPGSTLSTKKLLSLLRQKTNILDEMELALPEPHERADDHPEGYFTLYESFLEASLLWFPIPYLILELLANDRSSTEGSKELEDGLGVARRPRLLPSRLLHLPLSRVPLLLPRRPPLLLTSKELRLPSVTGTDPVTPLPVPLPSDDDAKRAAKAKGHEGDDRKRSSDRDDVTVVDRESKRARTRSASPPRHVSRSVFQDKASASSLFSTLVLNDDVVAPIDTKPSGEMMRQGLKFLALVNKVGHELEAEIEDLKKQVEDEKRRTENSRNAVDELRVERDTAWAQIDRNNQELTDKAKEIVKLKVEARKSAKRDGELSKVVDRLRRADEQIQSLQRKFARAKDKFDELQGDPRNNMVYQVQRVANLDFFSLLLGLVDGHEPPKLEDELTFLTADVAEHAGDEELFEQLMRSLHGLLHVLDPKTYAASVGVADHSGSHLGGAGSRKATVVSVDGKFSLIGGFGAEVTKSRIEDVAEGAGTVGVREEKRTDEDSQGTRIDALTEDPRLDDVFGEAEAEGAPVAQVARLGVDEDTVP